ncbi:MAG: hypothetical protein KGL17_07270 [Betaproteobacteria bacterium]|nr:hypothetical protein [Betaproteobacteria bacterium]
MSIQNVERHASAGARQISLQGAVIRCRCTDAQKAAPDWHGRRQQPCPRGASEDLGTLSFWDANPLKRLAWRLSRLMRAVRQPRHTNPTDWSRYG